MQDLLYKGHFKGLDIAFTYAVTTQLVNEIILKHDCDPAAAHVLGRATTAGLLSAARLPEKQRLNACWKYKGELKTVVVDAGQDGSVRSVISPAHLSDTGNDLTMFYGDIGDLQVVTMNEQKIINSGTAPIPMHDAVKDMAYFFCISDQIETGMDVMIGFQADPETPVTLCQGWMIQALPGTDLERFDRIRQRMESEAFRALLAKTSEADSYFEEFSKALTKGEAEYEGIHMDACPEPHFACSCSKEKMGAVVRSIHINDRMDIVKKKEPLKIRCQFCNELYTLPIDECIVLWNTKNTA